MKYKKKAISQFWIFRLLKLKDSSGHLYFASFVILQ